MRTSVHTGLCLQMIAVMFEWVLTSLLTTPNPKCTEIIDNYQMQYVTRADRKDLLAHVTAYFAFRSPVFGDIGLKRALVMGKFMSRLWCPPTHTTVAKAGGRQSQGGEGTPS